MLKRLLAMTLLSFLLVQAAGAEEQTVYRLVSEEYKIYELADTGWLIEHWATRFNKNNTEKQAQSFNKVMSAFDNVKTYVYLINSSRTIDMDHMDREPAVWTVIKDSFPNSTLGSFNVKSIEEYKKFFYKTDHHWNYYSSYEGYKQIIRMLLGKDEPLMKPLETVEFPVIFNGSYNRYLKREDSDDKFIVYRFDFPKMVVNINHVRKKDYGRQDEYFKGKYSTTNKLINHWGQFYGGIDGIIDFWTNQPDKENIIIICNSFSNPIKKLIASHFNHTYFIDPRYYNKAMGEDFSLERYVPEWNVSKVMLLGNGHFFSQNVTYK